ncbi:biopolymer transporter ExbB [Paracoccus pacificus]|uniref:Biopolymer transporter ExbB n=1 Tax=Paracoccus pacificus TaxID=1463598 RepID=A0ABW4RAK1_9RHOB
MTDISGPADKPARHPGADPAGGGAGKPGRAGRVLAAQRVHKTPATPPRFSQPVRQVFLMLVVLGAVIAGGWFAYGKIYPIFQINPWLNGVILSVFVIGVLACFWQVAQLINSVSWIERFAARRSSASVAGVATVSPEELAGPGHAPRLLAPLAALLGPRGPVGGVISASSAGSILESVATRVEEARDITRYISNLLIFLGLLGTFYGLSNTVPGVVDTIRALAPQDGETGAQVFDKLMTGLETQLGGMGTAFSSSLLGLFGSLVVGLLELFANHGQNRFYRELEEWLSSFTRLGIAGDGVDGLDQASVAGVLDQMTAHLNVMAQQAELRDRAAAEADQRMADMAAGIELIARVQDAAPVAAAIDRVSAGQSRLIEISEAQTESVSEMLRKGSFDDPESRMRLRSIDVQMLQLLEELTAARQTRAGDGGADVARLTEAVERLTATLNALTVESDAGNSDRTDG